MGNYKNAIRVATIDIPFENDKYYYKNGCLTYCENSYIDRMNEFDHLLYDFFFEWNKKTNLDHPIKVKTCYDFAKENLHSFATFIAKATNQDTSKIIEFSLSLHLPYSPIEVYHEFLHFIKKQETSTTEKPPEKTINNHVGDPELLTMGFLDNPQLNVYKADEPGFAIHCRYDPNSNIATIERSLNLGINQNNPRMNKISYKTFNLPFHKVTMCILRDGKNVKIGLSACSIKDKFIRGRGENQALSRIERHGDYVLHNDCEAFDTPIVFRAWIRKQISKIKSNPHEYLGWYSRRLSLIQEIKDTEKHLSKLKKSFNSYDPKLPKTKK